MSTPSGYLNGIISGRLKRAHALPRHPTMQTLYCFHNYALPNSYFILQTYTFTMPHSTSTQHTTVLLMKHEMPASIVHCCMHVCHYIWLFTSVLLECIMTHSVYYLFTASKQGPKHGWSTSKAYHAIFHNSSLPCPCMYQSFSAFIRGDLGYIPASYKLANVVVLHVFLEMLYSQ